MKASEFLQKISKAKTEEDVKRHYIQYFKLEGDTEDKHDLYTPQALFEFKLDKNLEHLKVRAQVIAQLLNYVHELKFGQKQKYTKKNIPAWLIGIDKDQAFFAQTKDWKKFYIRESYDWDLSSSTPDVNLIRDLEDTRLLQDIHVYRIPYAQDFDAFSEKLSIIFDPQTQFELGDKKLITEENFEDVYQYWCEFFEDSVRNGTKPSEYFLADIQGKTIVNLEESKVSFEFENGEAKVKKILAKHYEYFWSLYERQKNPTVIRGMLAKIDRLTDDTLRRFEGEFYTPLPFCKKALEYIEETIGKKWWNKGYKMWDMAAGTGNLQYYLPAESWHNIYLSTLHKEEADHCQKIFPWATCFQYDYLNDDIDYLFTEGELPFNQNWKLPKKLRDDLSDPKNKWIIFINPPFATSQTAGANSRSKKDASNTKTRVIMHEQDLGEVSRELFSQFLFRIKNEFKGRVAHLGLFAKLKYINSNNDQKLRDTIFQFPYKKGFIFSIENFYGTKGKFPVSFVVWDLEKIKKLDNQKIVLDIFDRAVKKIGHKDVSAQNRVSFLSKWIDRPKGVKIFPPMKSAINIALDNKDTRDRVSDGFIGSLLCAGNDPQHSNLVSILSGPFASAGGHSITPSNFEKAMVIHAVRRVPKSTWINDRDQYMTPLEELSEEFITDCVVWNLFSGSNQTSALKDVKYKNNIYQIKNEFFPFSNVKRWKVADSDIGLQLTGADDTFVAKWLKKRPLSSEAKAIMNIGERIYQFYFEHLNILNTPKFKIQTWDSGWWQIRMSLSDQHLATNLMEELKINHNILKGKLLLQIYKYGFLPEEKTELGL